VSVVRPQKILSFLSLGASPVGKTEEQDVTGAKQDVACFARQDVAARLFAQQNTVCLLASSLPGCSQRS
jgi:hypothetical protein